MHDKEFDALGIIGGPGVLAKESTKPNIMLISFSKQIMSMYNQKKLDPYTGAPISKRTYETAQNIYRAFMIIEQAKKNNEK